LQWVNPNDVGSTWIQTTAVTRDVPSEDDVRDGVLYDDETLEGNMALTNANNLRKNVGIGTNGIEIIGNMELTTSANIRNNIGIGAAGVEVIGNMELTTSDNIRNNIGIGAAGIEVIGNIELTTANNIKKDVGIGAAGTEVIGTLKGNQFTANVELVQGTEKYLSGSATTYNVEGTIVFSDDITNVSLTLEYRNVAGAWTNIGTVTGKDFVADTPQNIEDLFSIPTVNSGETINSYIIKLTPSHADIYEGNGQKAWGTRDGGVGVRPSKPENVTVNAPPSKPVFV